VAKTQLGWDKAQEHAKTIVKTGGLSREQHLEALRRFLKSPKSQDKKIALALLELYIDMYEDFDSDVGFKQLVEWGNELGGKLWSEFGKSVIYKVLLNRSLPAVWIDQMSDEGSTNLRKSFATAIVEISNRKSEPLERVLGILEFFMDEPELETRKILAQAFRNVGARDPERLHYFMNEFSAGAGSNRTALFKMVKEKTGKAD
jgi:hypothetical protein